MSKNLSLLIAALSLLPLCACSVLEPGETGLGANEALEVTTSNVPVYRAKDVPNKKVKDNLTTQIKDEGMGVTWEMQGVYPDNYSGSVLTFLLRNDNDIPLPPSAITPPVVEISDGNGGWTRVDIQYYDPEQTPDVIAPGLDLPLGAHAATNLQYRIDTTTGSMSDARVTMGNVTWIGNLNV